jgi:nitrite reductase (NADH) small subunit
MIMTEFLICREGELAEGGVRIVQTPAAEIGIFHRGGQYFAYRNFCPHQGGPACEGVLMPQVIDVIGEGGVYNGQSYDERDMHIVCPWHSYEFHLSDGTHVCDKNLRLKKYEVVRRDGQVYVVA